MARVTVEDCVEKVDNRFELVVLAAQRAKSIASGAPITIQRDNDKDSVVALREIALETILVDDLRNQVVQGFQKPFELEDDIDTIATGSKKTDAAEGSSESKEPAKDEVAELMGEETEASITAPQVDEDSMSFAEENLDVED